MGRRLHEAFKRAMQEPSDQPALARYDMVPMDMGSAACLRFAQETFQREKATVEKLGLAKPS